MTSQIGNYRRLVKRSVRMYFAPIVWTAQQCKRLMRWLSRS
jgi:hypothetical protein